MVECLDFGEMLAASLEDRSLQVALGYLPKLNHVVLPWHGWTTPNERVRFIRSFTGSASFEGVDSRCRRVCFAPGVELEALDKKCIETA